MVLWTIYVQSMENDDIEIFTIDNEKTFGEFRKLVSVKLGIYYADLVLCGKEDYDSKYNSKKLYSINGISDGCTLFAVLEVGGGGDYRVNLSKELINVEGYNSNILFWRTIGKGINLYGICQNSKCVAKGKQVIKNVDSKEYDVYNEGFMGICPMCGKHFDLDTCSFYKCDYKCEGTYFDYINDEWVDLPDITQKTSGGKDFYYDFNENVRGKEGKVKYKKLKLKVINYHDIE